MKSSRWLDRESMPRLPYMTLCLTEREYLQVVNHLKVKDPMPWLNRNAAGTTHFFTRDGYTCCVVCIQPKLAKSYEQVAGLLVHEAVHVWQEYRDTVLMEKHPGSELEAYSIQKIVQNLLEAYRRQRRG
jgi:hypothetical protein